MNKYCLLLILLLATTFVGDTLAQPRSRDLGIFADLGASSWNITAPAFVPTFFYVLGYDLDGGVKGFEFEILIDPQVMVLDRALGQDWSNAGDLDNFIVDTGACLNADGVWYQLVRYQVGLFMPVPPNDVVICPAPATPSRFVPAVPGYEQCDGTLVPFGVAMTCPNGVYPNGCGVINATDPGAFCPTVDLSFGGLKTLF